MRAQTGSDHRHGPPPRRRPWALLALLVAVLWLHGRLIDGLARGLPRQAGVRAGAALQVRAVVVDRAPALPIAPARPATAARATQPTAAAGPESTGAAPEPSEPPEPLGKTVEPEVSPGLAMAGLSPPTYPTRIPAPALLRYALQSQAQVGEASLIWRHDDQGYRLQLDGRGLREAPLIEQHSAGGFDAAGLAPERFTDRRRGRGWRAASFQREIGRISFSGPSVEYPAWPGAQDRLSWLVQAAAIHAAAVPKAEFTLFVVDARGVGELWRFTDQGLSLIDTPLGQLPAQHWLREPDQAGGQRVEVWLDATRGHWPVQVRFTFLRTQQVFELRLAAEPQTLP
jgi:hypothetical protein